jgi:DNA-directed RNA polymerase
MRLPVFFPHNIDFRGRFYPSASHISPQGNDLARALLRYAEHKPLGKDGLDVLKIYAATLAGHDKISYADRIKWFDTTWVPVIKGKGKFDPFDHKIWIDYDSPLQFLQVLWEIQGAINSPDPTKFMSSVSVNIDGSQNGIQHLSALMRDEIGGKSVNLVDAELPADLYMDVADKVKEIIEEDYKDDPNATDKLGNPAPPVLWKPIFESKKRRRGIVKRPVLAYPYGVTIRGMHDSLIADGHTDGLQGSQYYNADYLANVINESVKETVIQAAILMEYLRDITKTLADNGIAISWTTPFGLPINQKYIWEESRVIKTCLHSVAFYVPNGAKGINTPAQVRGIVANFIHSLDSSHAGYIALDMKDEKMNSVQFVHDSIGTHACNVKRLHEIIRKTFINMHNISILDDFVRDLSKATGIQLSPPPPKGKLKLESVRTSRWFFA